MATELELAYSHCQRVAKENARNFYYTFRPLPADKRRAIYAVYAYCRLCDDIADGDLPVEDKYRGFAEVRRNLQSSTTAGEDAPMYLALRHAAETFGIPYSYLDEILQGVEMDMVKTRFADFFRRTARILLQGRLCRGLGVHQDFRLHRAGSRRVRR